LPVGSIRQRSFWRNPVWCWNYYCHERTTRLPSLRRSYMGVWHRYEQTNDLQPKHWWKWSIRLIRKSKIRIFWHIFGLKQHSHGRVLKYVLVWYYGTIVSSGGYKLAVVYNTLFEALWMRRKLTSVTYVCDGRTGLARSGGVSDCIAFSQVQIKDFTSFSICKHISFFVKFSMSKNRLKPLERTFKWFKAI